MSEMAAVIIETVTKPEDGRREQGELNAGWKHFCNSFNAQEKTFAESEGVAIQ